jgi:hypothetical protein
MRQHALKPVAEYPAQHSVASFRARHQERRETLPPGAALIGVTQRENVPTRVL